MTRGEDDQIPAAPTPMTDAHECGYTFREGLGYLANDPECEPCCEQATAKWKSAWSRTAHSPTVVQYGGQWSVVTGHRLPPLTGVLLAVLQPDHPSLPSLPWVDAKAIERDLAEFRAEARADAAAAEFVSGSWS